MSAGKFKVGGKYETKDAKVVKIKIQPETESLTINSVANTVPAGAVDKTYPSARVSGGRSTLGIMARLVRVKFTSTTPPNYDPDGIITLPVLTLACWAEVGSGVVGTYAPLGTALDIIVVGSTDEKIN